MRMEKAFEEFCKIDVNRIEYINLKKNLLEIDWGKIIPKLGVLAYGKGFTFVDFPWTKDKPIFKEYSFWPKEDNETVNHIRQVAVPFFDYIETLTPNHYIARAELLYTFPEKVSKLHELNKMHTDCNIFHNYLKRCQFAFLTNSKSLLWVEDECINIQPNTMIQFNNRKVHWGVNYGDSPKLVMIVEFIEHGVWEQLPFDIQQNFFDLIKDEDDLNITLNYKKQFLIKHNSKCFLKLLC